MNYWYLLQRKSKIVIYCNSVYLNQTRFDDCVLYQYNNKFANHNASNTFLLNVKIFKNILEKQRWD